MNTTPSIKNETISTRVISIFFLFVLFSNEIVSFSYASDLFENRLNRAVSTKKSVFSKAVNMVSRPNSVKKVKALPKGNAVYGGPGQAESSGFSLNSTDGMVDKFTGDFSYSIPLMDVEGYPIELKYNSNTTMNSEASWVGLGWDLNLGSISREMRGLPDEFNGEQSVVRTFSEKQDNTSDANKFGGYFGFGKEFDNFFTPSIQVTALFGKYQNSILGEGKTKDIGLQAQFSRSDKDKQLSLGVAFGLGYSSDSKHGVGINKSFGISGSASKGAQGLGASASGGVTFGSSYNSRAGLISKSFSWELGGGYLSGEPKDDLNFGADGTVGFGSTITYGTATSIPRIATNMTGNSFSTNARLFLQVKTPAPASLLFNTGMIFQTYDVTNKLEILNHQIIEPAFGYLHSGKRANFIAGTTYPIMDYNRTTESGYSEEMKNLPFSIQTFDIFYANAMGLSGTFRARRDDFGTFYDPEASTKINGAANDDLVDVDMLEVSVGVKLANGGASIKLATGITAGSLPGTTESKVLKVNSTGGNVLEFNTTANGAAFDNSIYFKSVGENTPETLSAYDELNGTTADCFNLTKVDKEIHLTNQLANKGTAIDFPTLNGSNSVAMPTRVIATHFIPKTVAEFSSSASYENHPLTGTPDAVTSLARLGEKRKSNHISAVEVVNTNGVKYTYGIPVYTVLNDEVTFAAGRSVSLSALSKVAGDEGLITYSPGVDNSINNARGWTNYYDKTQMPAYAHSFLLTEMVSSDYVDRQNDGLSLDDAGSYYKFNYSRVFGEGTDAYKWRYPVSGGSTSQAMLSRGFTGSELDDMAHYTYGEKEIWYAQSVESKNLIAEFVLSTNADPRLDAYSVLGENGGLDTDKPLKRLDKIVLYNRADKLANPTTAKPIQTVEFIYDYSLCLKNPSNKNTYISGAAALANSGKLTLKSIRVYTGDSKELGLSKTVFEYSTFNPDFNYTNVDGWGNYKPNNPVKPNDIFPYAEQDVDLANERINAYKLTAINNAMGGRIEIEYEADRYAYVQNKRAMRYMDVAGMTNLFEFLKLKNDNSWNGTMYTEFTKAYAHSDLLNLIGGTDVSNFISKFFSESSLSPYNNQFGVFDNQFVANNVIIFKLDKTISSATYSLAEAEAQVQEKYFRDPLKGPSGLHDELYFKLKVNVNSTTNEEIIPCNGHISGNYADVFGSVAGSSFNDNFTAIGVMPKVTGSADYEYGYVVLDPVNSGDQEFVGKEGSDEGGLLMHPLQRTSLDYIRKNLPDIIYGSCDGCTTDLDMDNAVAFGSDMYKYMMEKGNYSPKILTGSSVRLNEPDNEKFGGNARVKKITYIDNWAVISGSGEYTSLYQWDYQYLERTQRNGVAAYESRAIKDENPFYFWDTYTKFNKHFPDETQFTPMPVSDALFPSAIVGYQEVQLNFDGNAKKGYSSSKFFTAKDFPTVEKRTTIDKSAKYLKHGIITGKTVDLFGFSQGFSVETNDFHGKPREMTLYNKLGQLQSRSTYKYYNLGEKVPMMDRSSNMNYENIALEYDMHTDSRFIEDETKFSMLGLNLDWTLAPTPSFIPIPSPIFYKTSRKRGFYSNALVKHINRSAIVKEIETEYMGSINMAENLVYDRFTGNVIASSLTDEFNDKLYSVNFPSHWYYPNLRDRSGVDYSANSGTLSSGVLSISGIDLRDKFSAGDILLVHSGGTAIADAWILQVNQNSLVLIHENGTKYTGSGTYTISLRRTNRKNRLNETMQSVVTKISPLSVSNTVFTFPTDKIISSSAVTYRNRNNVRCGIPGYVAHEETYGNNEVDPTSVINPFKYGVMGDLVIDKQFAWKDERSSVDPNGIRFNGTYAALFYPFYKYNAAAGKVDWYKVNEVNHPQYVATDANHFQKWFDLGKVTVYNEYGVPLESLNQLGNYSSVLYGYNSALDIVPIAQAVNATQQNIAFDGFEDYNYYSTFPLVNDQSHFDFRSTLTTGIEIQSIERHSGFESLKLSPGKIAEVTKSVVVEKVKIGCDNNTDVIVNGEFTTNECICIKPFQPSPDKYIIGVWVKEDNSLNKESYLSGIVSVLVNGVSVGSFLPSGNIVDGWQRLEGVFTISDLSLLAPIPSITIQLKNTSSTETVYFDDFRIHPFLSGMTTVVYDPKTLLPMASHDGYNFTTFFNYDENLNQVRVRVETEKGIQTVSEGESGSYKPY